MGRQWNRLAEEISFSRLSVPIIAVKAMNALGPPLYRSHRLRVFQFCPIMILATVTDLLDKVFSSDNLPSPKK